MLERDDLVRHASFGLGRVIVDNGDTTVVRFEHGIEECLASQLVTTPAPVRRFQEEAWDSPLEVVTRVQAEAIRSVNDQWGVFSLSRISLLPHQLWVCRKVLEQWPAHWLIADDVGLGKTIEAGLILWPLLSRGTVQRLLVLCPASLVEQWQYRLRTMFDIRLARYVPEADTKKGDFWHTHTQVVASLQTLRADNQGRHERMLEAPDWDLLVVDEAHHLNADEETGPTLGYRLVTRLVENKKIRSSLFFTGTPHRGKNFGFLSLLKLLRPDWFDPKKPLTDQLDRLSQVMIRNNKQCVTDLQGQRLFQAPKVSAETYEYSPEEQHFYDLLTEFISTGKAYASSLSSSDRRMVTLVLIAMQKLASSSVAAIRRALQGRLARIAESRKRVDELQQLKKRMSEYLDLQDPSELDEMNQLEEQLAEAAIDLLLMQDEEPRLRMLVEAAAQVTEESKINTILDLVEKRFQGESVLFFTEYKATQSLLMSALIRKYGDHCVTFINGDGEARDVVEASGKMRAVRLPREEASDRFNEGQVRFLVSTEAAGEGIDLQRNCHILIHVDLPWNPMRMHQRVGRLNRYGQTKQVHVVSVRNPDTVESRVWDKLTEKLTQITRALRNVMAEPEDLQELVLGMTSPMFFNDLFSEGEEIGPDSFSDWFDQKTSKFGNEDVLDTVRSLLGNSARFDFQEVSDKLPKVDLPDLKPFFASMVAMNGRRIQESDGGLSFLTPEGWVTSPRIMKEYRDLRFERTSTVGSKAPATGGVGHAVFDEAMKQARETSGCVTALPRELWPHPLFVFQINDRVTTTGATVRSVIAGVRQAEGELQLIRDWEVLRDLNSVLDKRTLRRDEAPHRAAEPDDLNQLSDSAAVFLKSNLKSFELPYSQPEISLVAAIVPAS